VPLSQNTSHLSPQLHPIIMYESERLKTNGSGFGPSTPRVSSWAASKQGGPCGGAARFCAANAVALLSVALFASTSAAIGLGVTANNLRAASAGGTASPAPSPLVAFASNFSGFTATPFTGTVSFTQAVGSPQVVVTVALAGLSIGAHGFHVHAITDISGGCGTAGHFNPNNAQHAFPSAPSSHAGDLGNIFADATGIATATFVTTRLSLVPGASTYFVGQTLMVHALPDDGVSQPTGNAGARLGCSLITAPSRAVAAVWAGGSAPTASFSGSVVFSQAAGSPVVTVAVALTGLPPGLHGFHVHDMTTATQGCGTAGHLNPTAQNHSFPSAVARHVGDLGNIVVDASGAVTTTFTDSVISLFPSSPGFITGYVLVVHAGIDDGITQPTGGAGSRLGCSIIAAAA